MGAGEYIEFRRVGDAMPAVLTERWEVINRRSGLCIGVIKWHPAWRRYALFPVARTIWDAACLDAVIGKIETLHRIRRNVRVNQGKEA